MIVQTPEDLLPSVYMTLNRLAPAWEGLELGIGDATLLKTIANTTGRSQAQLKADMERLGDVGIIAEQSKGSQRTMFQVKKIGFAKVSLVHYYKLHTFFPLCPSSASASFYLATYIFFYFIFLWKKIILFSSLRR